MSNIVQNLINNTLGDGARAAKHRVLVELPKVFDIAGEYVDTVCKTVSMPGKSIDVISVKHKGRDIPVPGQEKFAQSLELTFYLEEDHKLRVIFDRWIQGLNYDSYSNETSEEVKGIKKTSGFTTNIVLHQLNFEGAANTAVYTFHNIFPKEIGSATFDSTAIDTILEYTVTFSYSHYDVISPEQELSSADLADKIMGTIQSGVNKLVQGVTGAISDALNLDGLAASANEGMDEMGKDISKGVNYVGTQVDEFLEKI
jgi:hypothetical protein